MQDSRCTINELLNRFGRQYDNCLLHSPANEGNIQRAQGILGAAIPGDYMAFLHCANGGELFAPGTLFYGAAAQDVPVDMLLTYHNSLEQKAASGIPAEWMVIGKTNFGDPICMNEAGTVAQWDMEMGEVFLTWNSLTEYLCYEEDLYLKIEGGSHD